MTQDDIIRMAREAGMKLAWIATMPGSNKMKVLLDVDQVERFAALVRADEREACAQVCDDKHHTWRWDDEPDSASGPRDCAAAIRARGQE